MRRLLVGLVLGWLLGVGSGLGYVAVSGGWYEYHLTGNERLIEMVNREGWEPYLTVPDQTLEAYLRRPRFRLP